MTSIVLSKRLKTIADYCPAGSRVADIGSDHALLASYLLANGLASFVIAGELNDGPYQAAREQVAKLAAADRASVRKGDGLAVLAPGETDVICIAGMGGQLIASILERGKAKLPGVKRLILQPNVGEEVVRRWLLDNG
jgi:tRNA (adenine22-N1)-methyltransferase